MPPDLASSPMESTTSPKKRKDKLSKKDKKKKRHEKKHDENASLESHPKKDKKKRKREENTNLESASKKHKKRSQKHAETVESNTTASESDNTHCIVKQTYSLYLPLSPITQLYPVEGLCAEHLSPHLLSYYPPFHAVILAYDNVRLSEDPNSKPDGKTVLAKSIDEYVVSFIWLTADFYLFKPERGAKMEGWINLQSEGHLGLVCYNLFNATIERKRLPKEWAWVPAPPPTHTKKTLKGSDDMEIDEENQEQEEQEDQEDEIEEEGHFEDVDGDRIEGKVTFTIKDVEAVPSSVSDRGLLMMEGTLLSEEDEATLLKQEYSRTERMKKGVQRETQAVARLNSETAVMTGAL
ncbi:MAG: hypothetical protein M1834_007182 [Cirrosporium novae-zelandiae]|nr:MAG: hypothetical protein M1834_007182 [Cirrosporium novae-zelandiae]